jgi:outer membrane protein OmpA-like peptidoglycan-associated protein
MRTFLALLLAAIALGILAYFCIGRHAPVIAEDLRQRGTEALTAGGHAFASIEGVNGRDVTLIGEAPNEEAKFAAIRDVDRVWGVRTVVDKMTVAAPEPEPPAVTPYLFQANLADGALTLTGAVPSEDVRREILSKAQTQFPGVRLVEQLVIRESVPNAEWPAVLAGGMAQLASFESGELKMEDLAVSLSGKVKSQEIYAAADKAMQAFPQPFTAAFNATVDAPVPAAREPAAPATPAPEPAAPEPAVEEPAPPAAPPTPVEKAAAQNCQRDFNRAFRGETINFETSSARISRSSQRLLRQLARIAGGCPAARFTIAGHTDNQGAPGANLRLSQARAAAVKDALARLGVSRARMGTRGFGETRPVANNRTAAGRAANRRIEFLVR